MRYAYYPGCVAKGTCPELHISTLKLANALGIELVELENAACCGAGIINAESPEFSDALNARTFAIAEEMGLDIITICSTCQGAMAKVNKKLVEDEKYREKMNLLIKDGGRRYGGKAKVKHLLWVLVEDVWLKKIKEKLRRPLTNLKIAPFYGCHILRPSDALGFDDPERPISLDELILALGAQPVQFAGKTRCCGFPILMENEKASLAMTRKHLLDAKDNGADCMVTPCPLCHLNLDIYQPKAARLGKVKIDLPVLHLPQMVCLALGMSASDVQLSKHIVPCKAMYQKIARA